MEIPLDVWATECAGINYACAAVLVDQYVPEVAGREYF